MTALDTPFILELATTLARNLAAAQAARYALPWVEPAYEQQLVEMLGPGLVAFIGRLTADLPPDYDLAPVLRRFCADPAVAAALNEPADADAARQALADAFLAAGIDAARLDRADFDAALLAWAAVMEEIGRQRSAIYQSAQQQLLLHAERPPREDEAVRRAMAALVAALVTQGLSRIDAGQVFAADGVTVICSFARRHAANGGGETFESVGESPGEAEEFSIGSGGLESIDFGLGETAEPLATDDGPPTTEEITAEGPPAPPTIELPLDTVIEQPAAELPPAVVPPAPIPPPPSPAPEPASVVTLRLDAAAPPRVIIGRTFDLAVAIRRPSSPALAPADLTQRESADFGVVWPGGVPYLVMRIQLSAPGCDIHGGDTRPVRILPGSDGPPVYFQLTPRQPGPLSLIITVYQETDWIGSARVLTEVGGDGQPQTAAAAPVTDGMVATGMVAASTPGGTAEPRGGLTLTVTSADLGNAEVNLMTLRRALDDGYSLDELRELCFNLEIDFEDLPGEGQSAKARELVLFARRRGLLAALVERVMAERPHLLVAA